MTTKPLQHFVVVVRSCSGDLLEWKMSGREVGQVILNAQELCPECEIVRVNRAGHW